MTSWIAKLRRKPKGVKDMYAFGGSLIVTGIIATVWLISLPTQFETPRDDEQLGSDLQETKGAFAQFFAGAKEQLSSVFASQATSTTNSTSTPEDTSSSTQQTNIVVPQLTASTTFELNQKPILIDTVPTSPVREPEEILIGTTTTESATSN